MAMLGSLQDRIVPSQQTETVYKRYGGPKRFFRLSNQHHEKRDLQVVLGVL